MNTQNTKVFFRYGENNSSIEAVASNLETGEEIARKRVLLRHGDNPNKLIGRKYAFKKLTTHILENSLLAGQEVGDMWRVFSTSCKQPKEKLAY